MRIIYRGGYNKYSERSVRESFWYKYRKGIEKLINSGKKVALTTLAKPDGSFDNYISMLPREIVIVDSTTKRINWKLFDVLFIPGGSSLVLFNNLSSLGFSLESLKRDIVLVGDSAGAYILSSYFYSSPVGEKRGKEITFHNGFNPSAKVITIAHINNKAYTNSILIKKVKSFARRKNITVLMLKENQEKLLDENRKFVEVEREKLFF